MTASVTAGDRNTVTYANDTDRSLVNSVTDAKGVATGYSYDSMRRLLATACGDAAVTNSYTDDLLSTLTHTNTSGKTTTYSFIYGAADLQTAVNIGSRNLVSNAYNSGTWTLSSQTYGNGDYWKYFYDNMDTLTSRFTNCSDTEGIGFYYTYNGKGKLVRIEMKSVTIADGAVTGGTLLSSENYLYDGSDRLIRVVETDGDNVVLHDFSWTYDAKDNVTALTESIGGKSFSYTYAYDDDSRPTTFGYGDVTEQVTYDGHGRSSGTTVKNGSRTVLGTGYAYRDVDSTYTTTQVKSVTNSYGGKTANFNYTYDANGNILSVSGAQAATYEYDDLGQLVWEKNAAAGKAWNYTYDNGGNVLSRTEYACSGSGTVSGSGTTTSYTYGDAEWGDLLTAYNGEAISYDGIGNPLSYRGWTMSWQGGRQLAGMTKGSDTLSFAYNESGLRTGKTVNGVTHNYVWQGSKLAADITDTYALYFHYDSSGEVIGFTRTANGTDTEYFYVKNLQGDILKVITATGTEAAAYTYDAWGRVLASTGDLADVNPIRYRGYYYDTETGLYYLKSRYYDPEVDRFISPDVFASTGQGIFGTNMFTYCKNNSIVLSDRSGTLSAWALNLTDSGGGYSLSVLHFKYTMHNLKGVAKDVGIAAWHSVSLDAGIGMGLYADADIEGVIGVGAGWYHDLVHISLYDGVLRLSQSETYGIHINAVLIDFGPQGNKLIDYNNNILYNESSLGSSFEFSYGAALYLGYIGVNAGVSFSLPDFVRNLINLRKQRNDIISIKK